jgi:hypothetical protein
MTKAHDFFKWVEKTLSNNREKRQLYNSMLYQNCVPTHIFSSLREQYQGTEEEFKENWNVIYTMLMMLKKQLPNRKTERVFLKSFTKDKGVRYTWFANTLAKMEGSIKAQEHALKPKKVRVKK